MKQVCNVHWLETIPYDRAWELQGVLAAEIAAGERPATLLLLEHPHTYTFGRSGHAENMLWDEAELARRGITVYWVDRGGDVTYHGPGQLVGYPLLPLAPGGLNMAAQAGSARLPQADYVGYIRRLEITLIKALATFGIKGEQIVGLTGVWVRPSSSRSETGFESRPQAPEKIAAIGVKVDVKGVSRHGFALNVDPDMSYWEGVIGCGLKDHAVTRLSNFVRPAPSMEEVRRAVTAAFGKVFDYQMVIGENISLSV
jgi:lipoyl(octanoyl) transferase